jgi:hypothetical protein
MEGEALFDGIYLARTTRSFRKLRGLRDLPPAWVREDSEPPPGRAEVWINGARVAALDRETVGREVVLEGEALREVLRAGSNTLAVYARNNESGRSVDIALRDDRLLARVDGDPGRPAGDERFPARVSFARPGAYDVQARVRILDESTGAPIALESPPLRVRIADTPSSGLLGQTGRSPRDLLAGNVGQLRASSEVADWDAQKLLDGRHATGWLCVQGDPAPVLTLELDRAVKADTLVLSPIGFPPSVGQVTSHPTRVRVVLDGKGDGIVAEVHPDPLRRTRIPLGKARKVSTLEVQILARESAAGAARPAAGFAELELELAAD